MRTAPVDFPDLIEGSDLPIVTKLEAWYAGQYLGEIPSEDGAITWDDGSLIAGKLKFTTLQSSAWYESLPVNVRTTPGDQYRNVNVDEPVGNDGQRVRVSYGVRRPGDRDIAWVQLGWFRVESATPDGAYVNVSAPDLMDQVQRARFMRPLVLDGSFFTYVNSFHNLLYPLVPFVVEGVADRDLPGVKTWERERLDAVQELLDTWPAKAKMDEAGVFTITPYNAVPDAGPLIRTGAGGNATLIKPEASADSGFNAAVAIGRDANGVDIHGVAYISAGRREWDGPYGENPGFYQSDMLTTQAQCTTAAAAQLQRWITRQAETWTATMRPDPRLELGDRCPIYPQGVTTGEPRYGIVTNMALPLQAEDGEMRVTLAMEGAY